MTQFRAGADLSHLSEDEIWRAKHVYDSAFHPDTGEKMFILGRMSAQVPMNMIITAAMLTFYKTPKQVIFWQWFNQSFNAMVNYTNLSGSSPIPVDQLGVFYLSATSAALVTALGLNKVVERADCWSIRSIRCGCCSQLYQDPTNVTEGDQRVNYVSIQKATRSANQVAAKIAIREVVTFRIAIASPGMIKFG